MNYSTSVAKSFLNASYISNLTLEYSHLTKGSMSFHGVSSCIAFCIEVQNSMPIELKAEGSNVTFINCRFKDTVNIIGNITLINCIQNATVESFISGEYCDAEYKSLVKNINNLRFVEHQSIERIYKLDIHKAEFIDIIHHERGGAIFIDSTIFNISIAESSFVKCYAQFGGGFYIDNQNTKFIHSICFTECFAYQYSAFHISETIECDELNKISIVGEKIFQGKSESVLGCCAIISNMNVSRIETCSRLSVLVNLSVSDMLSSIFQNISCYTLIYNDYGKIKETYFVNIEHENIIIDNEILKIINSSFINISDVNRITKDGNASLINCSFDNNKPIPKFEFQCFYYQYPKEDKSLHPTEIALIIVSSIAVVITITALFIIIYYRKYKSIAEIEKKKSSLSQQILSDFG